MINPFIVKPFIMQAEYWIPITDNIVEGINPWYYVSNYGNIYSIKYGNMLKLTPDKDGYLMVCLHLINGTHITRRVHRLVMMLFLPIDNPEQYQVNHINGIKWINYIWNLEWVTPKENVLHAYRIGLIVREKSSTYKSRPNDGVTIIEAEEIAKLLSLHQYSHAEIAEKIGCTVSVVNNISSGTNWKPLYDKYDLGNKPISEKFSDEQLHTICQYFVHEKDNPIYKSKNDLYRKIAKDMNMEFNDTLRRALNGIHNRERYHQITSLYNY